jgi:hypothetical protein
VLKQVGIYNCNSGVLNTNTMLFELLDQYWQGKNKCMSCVKQCSKSIYDSTNKYE